MKTLTNDFIGFSYNGIHSSDLGIIRTSDGSRFNENLLPVSQDKVVQVPGQDGSYFFGSQYTQQQFNINFAFDGLTEQQLHNLAIFFGDKKIHPLVFDERPYKTYMVKVTGSTMIKHIPFSQGALNRIYKGEGTIQFTCYEVYAKCENKFWEAYYNDIPNIDEAKRREKVLEWNYAANLLKNDVELEGKQVDKFIQDANGIYMDLYNPGAKESPMVIEIKPKNGQIPANVFQINDSLLRTKAFAPKKAININQTDSLITLNSNNKLIEGWVETTINGEKKLIRSGNIYNEYIESGDFLKVPKTVSYSNGEISKQTVRLNLTSDNDLENFNVKYFYYYF